MGLFDYFAITKSMLQILIKKIYQDWRCKCKFWLKTWLYKFLSFQLRNLWIKTVIFRLDQNETTLPVLAKWKWKWTVPLINWIYRLQIRLLQIHLTFVLMKYFFDKKFMMTLFSHKCCYFCWLFMILCYISGKVSILSEKTDSCIDWINYMIYWISDTVSLDLPNTSATIMMWHKVTFLQSTLSFEFRVFLLLYWLPNQG